jgi:hypothetical protein
MSAIRQATSRGSKRDRKDSDESNYTDEYSVEEIRALYANYHISDANGTLEGLTVIDSDSGAGLISQVVLFAGSGAAVVVLKSDYVQL